MKNEQYPDVQSDPIWVLLLVGMMLFVSCAMFPMGRYTAFKDIREAGESGFRGYIYNGINQGLNQ